MTAIESNRCYACRKLFCCEDCCIDHVRKKHPRRNSECPLCRSEKLIVKNFDNPEFLCHVLFNHLPLYCRICGLEFKDCEDLRSLGGCRRISVRREDAIKSPFTPDTPSPLNKTPCGLAIPAGPDNSTVDGDYNGNFGSVVSPPEFTRNTSTPMHVTGGDSTKVNFVFKTPKSPFYPKTPRASGLTTKHSRNRNGDKDKENDSPNESSYGNTEISSCNQSTYHSCFDSTTIESLADRTPLRSILTNRSLAMMSDSSSYATINSNDGGKRLDSLEEIDENTRIEDIANTARSLLATIEESSPLKTTSDNRHKDSSKRVRFSDQFEIKDATEMTTSTVNDFEPPDSDVFYEARESMTEMSLKVADKLSLSSARIDDENEKNFKREQRTEDAEDTRTLDRKSESPRIADSTSLNETSTSSSSRVIMMVVVEKNGTVNSNDLVPLIDSSLKKLVANNTVETFGNSVESGKRSNDESRPGTSVVSVDSYMSVSTVECYKTPDGNINTTRNPRESTESNNSVGSGGGIFAAVAHAMKMAFRNFSGATSLKNVSREPLEQNQQRCLLSAIPEPRVSPSRVLTSLASALAPRTAKRSRDVDETTPTQQSPEHVDSPNDVRSPVSKRPRGWYKIRAREPIARMRNVTSPRGVSSETQCFQQGSLSVGDTILTLPSRAHQSTQTD